MTELKTDNTVPEFLRTVIGDASAIAEIENVCFTSKWTEKLIIEEISNKNSVSFVCKINNNIVGYIFFRYLFEEGEVLKICVLPSFRKFGIGYSLMEKALEIAYENGVEKVFLEVRESNVPAISLYEKFGFCVYAKRSKYYPDNGEDALLMQKNL